MIDTLLAEAAQSPKAEICGLLYGDGVGVTAIERCRNVAEDAACSFEIDPAALFAARRREREGGPALLGHYHSHPGGSADPSLRDAAAASADGAVWLILGNGRARAWRAVEAGTVHGRFVALTIELV